MIKVKMTIEQLNSLVERLDNNNGYHDGKNFVYVSIKTLPNGSPEITFEQPSQWAECNGHYYRYK